MIRQEAKQILEKTIDLLDVKYRTVYIMREVEGMSIAEIADLMGLTISNVKVRLHRTKGMMKTELYELSKHPDIFEFGYSKCDLLVNKVMNRI
ncbi:sigma-70 family RNA polymerase sigma factor [Aquimarina sp. I32.4]|uniref:sigma-70 family RNA polymerase sigma factor n=1 Tax=Aquimarina sp. I32.4 TaxID=2053903 RepID=UPI002100DD4D|nr:sigma-70 family RNA polymerase sigma factor [Aquimarina sp. I32.4]